jgi:hypothetical protein
VKCGCVHSLGVICGVFAGIVVALLLAEGRCVAAGGRAGEAGWHCEMASGAVTSLWTFATPGIVLAASLVAIGAYFAATALARRLLFR